MMIRGCCEGAARDAAEPPIIHRTDHDEALCSSQYQLDPQLEPEDKGGPAQSPG